jgi:hypothetical protein
LQIEFSKQEQDFCTQIDEFIVQYWPPEAELLNFRGRTQIATWYMAVVDAGWAVPHWPVEFGGTQWTAVQYYIWQSRCMAANAPSTRTFATEHVGPLLIEHLADAGAPQSEYLPGIQNLSQGWCFGWKEAQWPDLSQHMATTLTEDLDTGQYVLNGEKRAVLGISSAQWMLVGFLPTEHQKEHQKADIEVDTDLDTEVDTEADIDTEEYGLCIVDLSAPGVQVRPSSASQSQFGTVVFTNVLLGEQAILPISGRAFIQRMAQQSANSGPQGQVAVEVTLDIQVTAPALQRQLSDIQSYIERQGYIEDEELSRDINELGVDLAVLHALELRVLAQAHSEVKPLSPLILQISADKISAKLGALQIASFGYYALPDFDARLFDNEGPLYPHAHLFEQNAASLVGQGLVELTGAEEFELKDALASSELGLNDTSKENR